MAQYNPAPPDTVEVSNDYGNPLPVSGTFTANAGTNLNTSALALESGGNLAGINTKLPSLDTGAVPVLVKNGQLEIQNDTGNPIPVGTGSQLNVTGSGSALNAVLLSTACDAYRSVSVQITGTYVATTTFQVSNDNTNWVGLVGKSAADSAGQFSSSGTAPFIFTAALVGYQYFRVTLTSYTSGTATANAYFNRESVPVVAAPPTTQGVSISSGNVGISNITSSTSSSGTVLYTVNSAATTNAAAIKASGANLYGISVMNASAATKYVRLFNLTVAPTVGTSVPIMVVAVPATSSKEILYVPAVRFGTGLSVAITGGAAATDSTAVAAGDVQLLVSYA
jgi:hypothetical protein